MEDEPQQEHPEQAQPEPQDTAQQEATPTPVNPVEQQIETAKQYKHALRELCKDPRVAASVADMWWDDEDPSAEVTDPAQHLLEISGPDEIVEGVTIQYNIALSLDSVSLQASGYDEHDNPVINWAV